MARVFHVREADLDIDLKLRTVGKMLSVIYHCFVSQIKPECLEKEKKKKKPTYFEPGCCYRTLSVALIQRDDGDDVLRVGLQAGEGVYLAVAGKLHRLYFATFFQ